MLQFECIEKAKEVKDLNIAGIEIIEVSNDGSYDYLRSIRIKDAEGKVFEFTGGQYANRMIIHQEKPPVMVTKYNLIGVMFAGCNIPIDFTFDSKTDAEIHLDKLKKFSSDQQQTKLEIKEVSVPE